MYTVFTIHGESIGDKVILHRWVSLYDVSSLPSDIEVMDTPTAFLVRGEHRAWAELHDMRSVLEGAAELSGVDGQAEGLV